MSLSDDFEIVGPRAAFIPLEASCPHCGRDLRPKWYALNLEARNRTDFLKASVMCLRRVYYCHDRNCDMVAEFTFWEGVWILSKVTERANTNFPDLRHGLYEDNIGEETF